MIYLTTEGTWLTEEQRRQRFVAGITDVILVEAGEDDAYGIIVEAGKEPYGDVSYADPGYQSDKKKRYPIDSEEHIRAAWDYINKGKNSGKYSASQTKAIKGRIIGAWKRKIDKAGPPSAEGEQVDFDLCIEESVISDHFKSEGGKLKCKSCGATVSHPRAAAAHWSSEHEK